MSIKRNITAVCFKFAMVFVLASCGHVPLTSMVKLRNFDPTTTDIALLSVAVKVPENFRVGQDGVRIIMEMRKKDGTETRRETFTLDENISAKNQTSLQKLASQYHRLTAYRVAENDFERLNSIRSLARDADSKKLWSGSLSIDTKICRETNQIPKSVLISTYLKTDATGEYIPFLVNLDVVEEAQFGNVEGWAPLCSGINNKGS